MGRATARFPVLAAGLLTAALALVFTLPAAATAATSPDAVVRLPDATPTSAPPVPTAANSSPQLVEVGEYLNEVIGISLVDETFTLDFYLWLTWKGDLDPSANLDFINQVGSLARRDPFYKEPSRDQNGSFHQGWHIQGTFRNTLDFREYPQDEHVLALSVENADYNSSKMQFVQTEMTVEPQFDEIINGWNLVGEPRAIVRTVEYNTEFGFPSAGSRENFYWSDLNISFIITKPASGYVFQSVLPITIVVLIVLASYFMPLTEAGWSRRLGITVALLISAVLMRAATLALLPAVTYMVDLDTVFMAAYFVIFGSFGTGVLVANLVSRGKNHRAMVVNRAAAILCAVVFAGAVLVAFRF